MTTQKAFASYQEIIDLHTESDKVSVIGIHTPISDTPRKMFGGFFEQFKKFKYLGCSISLVPAARLPADPLQVSYDPGDLTIDPRDMLNPIMFHGCHGNDMGVILNRFYNINSLDTEKGALISDSMFQIDAVQNPGDLEDIDSDFLFGGQLENLYYKALTDNTWKKAHPQRGFRKSGLRPLVYSMATNMQFIGSLGQSGLGIPSADVDYSANTSAGTITAGLPVSQGGRQFFTPRLIGLGWLDTRNVLTTDASSTVDAGTGAWDSAMNAASLVQEENSKVNLPLVYMGMILMPPAYKTEQYYRMIINHHFAFKDFRGISLNVYPEESPSYLNFNDGDTDPTPIEPDDPVDPGDDPVTGLTFSYIGSTLSNAIYDAYGNSKQLPLPVTFTYNGHTMVISNSNATVGGVSVSFKPMMVGSTTAAKLNIALGTTSSSVTYESSGLYYVDDGVPYYADAFESSTIGSWSGTFEANVIVTVDGVGKTVRSIESVLFDGFTFGDLLNMPARQVV